jgi:hypothetical protein
LSWFVQNIFQSMAKFLLASRVDQGLIVGVGNEEYVLGSFAYGSDFGVLDTDAAATEGMAYMSEQTGAVAGNQLEHSAVVAPVEAEVDLGGGAEVPEPPW